MYHRLQSWFGCDKIYSVLAIPVQVMLPGVHYDLSTERFRISLKIWVIFSEKEQHENKLLVCS